MRVLSYLALLYYSIVDLSHGFHGDGLTNTHTMERQLQKPSDTKNLMRWGCS